MDKNPPYAILGTTRKKEAATMDMEKTGAYLASLRRGRDMTQQQVADILGVSNKTVSKWESGGSLR